MTVSKIEEKKTKEQYIQVVQGENKLIGAVSVLKNSVTLSEREKEAVSTLGECVTTMNDELKAIKGILFSNMVFQAEYTQRLMAKANMLHLRISTHCNAQMLTDLSELLIHGLRTHCDNLLPLESGYYKPHGENTLHIEVAHVATHGIEFLAHHLSNIHILPEVLHPVANIMPLLAIFVAIYEIVDQHRLIEQAHLVKPLKGYSDNERTAIYKNVINSTLLALATRIGNGKPIGHRAEKHCHIAGSLLNQWYVLLLTESIFTLAHLEETDNIEDLAAKWEKLLLLKFQLKENKMDTSKELQNKFFEENQIMTALKVQNIFTAPRDLADFPTLPTIRNFCDDFHRKIYDFVLSPYKKRTEAPYIAAFFCGYGSDEFDNLRDFQIRFTRALELLSIEIYPFISRGRDANFQLQLNLINSCLYGNLHKMLKALHWHKPANYLLMEELAADYGTLTEPLKLQEKTGKYQIVSALISAQDRIKQLENDLEISNKRDDAKEIQLQNALAKIKELGGDPVEIFKNNEMSSGLAASGFFAEKSPNPGNPKTTDTTSTANCKHI